LENKEVIKMPSKEKWFPLWVKASEGEVTK